MDAFNRVKQLIGIKATESLKSSSVAIFGLGGVGGYVAEALARSGVGKLALVDSDVVSETNINRQIIATYDTIGKLKTECMANRLRSINPQIELELIETFYLPETSGSIDLEKYDYVVDAVDTVTAKIEIITRAKEAGVKVISCMGTGGKLDIEALKVADISKTSGCPLARVLRRELKARRIKNVKVVYSTEEPIKNTRDGKIEYKGNREAPPSMIFVPAVAGLMLAKEVMVDIICNKNSSEPICKNRQDNCEIQEKMEVD